MRKLWYHLAILLLAAIGAKLIGPHGDLQVDKNVVTVETGSVEWPRGKRQLCSKVYHYRFRNGREKHVQPDRHTDRHFHIYISRDEHLTYCVMVENDFVSFVDQPGRSHIFDMSATAHFSLTSARCQWVRKWKEQSWGSTRKQRTSWAPPTSPSVSIVSNKAKTWSEPFPKSNYNHILCHIPTCFYFKKCTLLFFLKNSTNKYGILTDNWRFPHLS